MKMIYGFASAALLLVGGTACSGDDDGSGETQAPSENVVATASPSPAPPDPRGAEAVFRDFESAVLDGNLNRAWELYAASVEGTTLEFREEYGCEYSFFGAEFPKIQHMFERLSPLAVTGTFGDAPFSVFLEFTMEAATGEEFLVTLTRVQPHEPYRLRWFNNGQTVPLGGAPDPSPSPGDPQGFCGIWTGTR